MVPSNTIHFSLRLRLEKGTRHLHGNKIAYYFFAIHKLKAAHINQIMVDFAGPCNITAKYI